MVLGSLGASSIIVLTRITGMFGGIVSRGMAKLSVEFPLCTEVFFFGFSMSGATILWT